MAMEQDVAAIKEAVGNLTQNMQTLMTAVTNLSSTGSVSTSPPAPVDLTPVLNGIADLQTSTQTIAKGVAYIADQVTGDQGGTVADPNVPQSAPPVSTPVTDPSASSAQGQASGSV